jgi:hypothetical protein
MHTRQGITRTKRVILTSETWTRKGSILAHTRFIATCDGVTATAPLRIGMRDCGEGEAVRRLARKMGWDFLDSGITRISRDTFYVPIIE